MRTLASNQRVPYEGPTDAKILCVGEAPGGEEVGQGRPFVGKSGSLLERYLERHGVHREEVRLANLCQYRPYNNEFKRLLGSDHLKGGLNELEEEIRSNNYNVIIALGAWPLYYLTGEAGVKNRKKIPGTGIMTYRGSRLPAVERFGGESQKVFATMHPAYVLRNWRMNPVFHVDLGHAVEDSHFPELRYPEYDEFIDPSADVLFDLTQESLNSRWLAVDIETFPGGRFSCVGWAWYNEDEDRYKAVCITYKRADLHHYAQRIWESPTPKIFQYGTYDISFMSKFYGWEIGGYYDRVGWDTYVASASIYPDYPRSLEFLCSMYTRFPYYKDERKVWKEEPGLTMMTLWKYNLKDCVATLQIALQQMEEIRALFKAA